MYKDANDVKSNLILTTLSFMDYYSPSFGYFENVPGFLKFSLNAIQANQHKVVGGLEMGGLKFLVRSMLDMKYFLFHSFLWCLPYVWTTVTKSGLVCFRLPIMERHNDVSGSSSLRQRKAKFCPNFLNQHTTSQTAKHLISKLGRGRTKSPQSELPMGLQLTASWQSRTPSAICHDSTGIPTFFFCLIYKVKLTCISGNTPSQRRKNQIRVGKDENGRPPFLLWSARPPLRIAGFEGRLDISTHRKIPTNSALVETRRVIFSNTRKLCCLKRLSGVLWSPCHSSDSAYMGILYLW